MGHLQYELNKDKIGGWGIPNLPDLKETTSFSQCLLMPIATQSLEPGLSEVNGKNPRSDGILKSNLTLLVSPH